MARPVHFEICADDPERTARFYEQALGWSVQRWDAPGAPEYWLISTGDGPGIDGGLVRRGPHAFPGTTNTIEVHDLDGAISRVEEAGGQVLMQRTEVPGVGCLAYCCDPDGNAFGLMEPDEPA